jgi:hypothetical protein
LGSGGKRVTTFGHLAVEPGQLLDVEHRPAQGDPVQRERLDELVEAEQLAFVGHGPAHQRQVVEHRLRQVAGAPVVVQAHRVLALGDLGLVGVAQQRQVTEDRWRPTEGLVEAHVLGQRRDPLLGADDVGDAHEVVVHHVGQVVGRETVGFQQHLVVDLAPVEGDGPAEFVGDGDVASVRHGQADHVLLTGGPSGRSLLGRDAAAQTVVAELELLGLLVRAELLEALAGAEARVGVAGGHQLLDMLAVDLRPLALAIRPLGTALVGALVPLQAQPSQGLVDHLLGLDVGPLAVCVLDAQHEAAAVLLGQGVVEQGHVGGADVRIARGAGRDAGADRGAHALLQKKPPVTAASIRPGGEGGIRTPGPGCPRQLISSQSCSATPAPLRAGPTLYVRAVFL